MKIKNNTSSTSFKSLNLIPNGLKPGSMMFEGLRTALTPKEGQLLSEIHRFAQRANITIVKNPEFDVFHLSLDKLNKKSNSTSAPLATKNIVAERYFDSDSLAEGIERSIREMMNAVGKKL